MRHWLPATPRPTVLIGERVCLTVHLLVCFLVYFFAQQCAPVLQVFLGRLASVLGNSQLDQPVRGRLHIYLTQ
jgi:hypothetical protein